MRKLLYVLIITLSGCVMQQDSIHSPQNHDAAQSLTVICDCVTDTECEKALQIEYVGRYYHSCHPITQMWYHLKK